MRLGYAMAMLLVLVPAASGAAPIKIVASFSVLADMARQIAGGHAEVTALVGPGGDAHTFDPSPADAGKLADAGLVIANGLGLDGWIERLALSAGYTGPLVTASTGIETRSVVERKDGAPRPVTDPHAWQSLGNGMIYARNIEAALAAADPANATAYQAAAEAYTAKLKALDAEVRARLGAIPRDRRRVITSHDAFGYFGAAYGVDFLAPAGLGTDAEASALDMARLVDQIRSQNIRALFIETMTDPRLMESLARETGAAIGGALYSDALSAPDGPAPTYTAMFQSNLGVLIEGMARN